MTQKEAKELLPAMRHFANGGNLWWCDIEDPLSSNSWKKQSIFGCNAEYKIMNIIEDKHFEARKAFALGEEIEYFDMVGTWITTASPNWDDDLKYRLKPKDVYEWQWVTKDEEFYIMSSDYHTIEETDENWFKFEPSKRLRK